MAERSPFPREMLEQIGRVAVNWNTMEHLINLLLADLLGKKVESAHMIAIFTHTSFAPKLEVLTTLVDQRGTAPAGHPLADYKKLSSRLKEASSLRNQIIHSHYSNESGTVTRYSASARGTIKIKRSTVTVASLTQEADQIASVAASLREFIKALRESYKGAPQTGQ